MSFKYIYYENSIKKHEKKKQWDKTNEGLGVHWLDMHIRV
jgi:hypothetical protein